MNFRSVMTQRALTFFILIFAFQLQADSKFIFQMGTEGGYYDSETLGNRIFSRLIGRLNYSNTFDRNFVTLKTRLAPEVYGLSFSASTIKFSGQLNFGQRLKQFSWQSRLAARNYFYKSDQYDDFSFNIFQAGADIFKAFSNRIAFGTGFDYHYRDSSRGLHSQLDNYAVTFFGNYQISRANQFSVELCLESFTIRKPYESDSLNRNDGIRYGPKVVFNHRSAFILNFSYRLIRHTSDLLAKDHWENQMELLWGKIFARRWSLFFYLNYLFLPEIEQEIPIELSYTPINNENWYHLKLGYDINKRKEVYLKFGYTRDVLINNNLDFAGWQFLAGFDIKY